MARRIVMALHIRVLLGIFRAEITQASSKQQSFRIGIEYK